MGRTEDKIKEINEAIKKSVFAVQRGARAEVLPDGRIEYSVLEKSSLGYPYRARTSFRTILMTLEGEDLRRLYQKYGKKARR